MAVTSLASNAIGFRPYGKSGDLMLAGREKASASWVRGAVLSQDTAGRLQEISADENLLIVGVAAEPATTTTDAEVLFWPAMPGRIFSATFEDQTNTSSTVHAIVIGDMYLNYAIQIDDDGIHYVDENDSALAQAAVVMVGMVDWQDITNATVRARVLVSFLAGATIYEGTVT